MVELWVNMAMGTSGSGYLASLVNHIILNECNAMHQLKIELCIQQQTIK